MLTSDHLTYFLMKIINSIFLPEIVIEKMFTNIVYIEPYQNDCTEIIYRFHH